MRIPVHLKTGVYKIISYPSNMQNFNIENCFAQSIQIEDDISFVEGRNEVRSKESKLLEKEDIDIQFLPEGGSLVPGHRNNIAFCAVDCRGIPAKLTLLVRDNNNRIIDTIQTNSAGLGQFKLQIQNNKTYYARVLDSSGLGNKRYSLPGIIKGGAGLELVAQTKNTIQIKLLSGSDTKEIYRLVLVKGNKVLCSEEREISGSKLIKLKYKNTGTGVATLTVFRRDTPVAERLVFLDTEQRLKISSNLEYGAYPVRGRMKIDIQVTDSQDRPVQTFLSTSVIDSINCLSENLSTPDIRHLFWLRSSLKMNTPVHIPNMVLRRIGMDANNLVEDLSLIHI